jgi:hypothetical protein
MKVLPMAFTTVTLPSGVSTVTNPRPGQPGAKLIGRITLGIRSSDAARSFWSQV